MKVISWEIIAAGLLLSAVSIYVINQNSPTEAPPSPVPPPVPDSIQVTVDNGRIKVIELKSLKNLEDLSHLGNLENLGNLKNLENLKNLTRLLPAEIQSEVNREIDSALKDIEENENVKVTFNPEKGSIEINRSMAASSGTWSAVSPGIFAFQKKIDATKTKKTKVSMPYGSIDVSGTAADSAIFTIQASGQIASVSDLKSKLAVNYLQEDENAVFNLSMLPNGNRYANIHIQTSYEVPQQVDVEATTGAGHISSSQVSGYQKYETKGGHIKLEEIKGEVKALTSGGHISVFEASGQLELRSKGGHIRTEETQGELHIQTSGGNLEAEHLKGAIQATTNAGNIDLRIKQFNESVRAETSAGTITIWVPAQTSANLQLFANSVEIDDKLKFEGEKTSSGLTGTIGGGGPVIRAKTSYGNIILKQFNP